MKLSEHFHLEEFCRSETASRMGRVLVPPQDIVENLTVLCTTIMEPVRELFPGSRIFVSSGWRPKWLNNVIGGSGDSDHILGGADDFDVEDVSHAEAARRIAASDIPFRQLILEFNWIHISKPRPGEKPRREVLTAKRVGARTVYEQGINP